jgi:hypothetical protein
VRQALHVSLHSALVFGGERVWGDGHQPVEADASAPEAFSESLVASLRRSLSLFAGDLGDGTLFRGKLTHIMLRA